MARKSKREIGRIIDELNDDVSDPPFDNDVDLPPELKNAYAKIYDPPDVYSPDDRQLTDGEKEVLGEHFGLDLDDVETVEEFHQAKRENREYDTIDDVIDF